MNLKVKRLFQFLFVNDICWLLLSPFVYVSRRLEVSRANYKSRKTEAKNIEICKKIFNEEIVLHGIFKGLRYTDIQATGSSVYAKLLGSYELEIVPVLQKLLQKNYTACVNIGCDEGYYAVGIANLCPQLEVLAFDCNKKAQERCKSLARINNVAQTVTVKGCFDINLLLPFNNAVKRLFIIDCEGCEDEIFTEELIPIIKNTDFIIELHYQKHPQILSKLEAIFSATHEISLITALSDHERVMNYSFAELTNLSYKQKYFILNEREGFMQWFIAESIII